MSEFSQSPQAGIAQFELPVTDLRGIEEHVAESLGEARLNISPNTWVVDAERDPESAIALGAIREIAEGVIQCNPLYEGAGTTLFGDSAKPNAFAFISPTLSRPDLEMVRGGVVEEVNSILARLRLPYKL